MVILGIYPSHDSGAAVVTQDGQLVSAMNEGRVIGEKLYWGFPEESISAVLEIANVDANAIDAVAVGGRNPAIGAREAFDRIPPKKRLMELLSFLPGTGTRAFSTLGRSIFSLLRDEDAIRSKLAEIGIDAPVIFYDHHESHAAAAYYTSPFDNDTLVITADAQGDFRSGCVYTVGNDGQLVRQAWTPFYHSLGKYWAYVTFNLGFTPMRHEGKIAGLAAQGNPEVCIDVFRKYIDVNTDRLQFRSRIGCWNNPAAEKLHETLQGYRRADIAAALQTRTEEVVTQLVDEAASRFDCSYLALAGGLFANVKLNQRLLQLDTINNVFIHPHMGDGGLGVGAAYLHLSRSPDGGGNLPQSLRTVFLGTSSTNTQMKTALDASEFEYERVTNPHKRVGELVASGYVVGRFHGRLEYGPRALGNRSILALPTDSTSMDWLNDRLDRTKFMPFSPSVLIDRAEEYFELEEGGKSAGKFMTMTFDVTDRAKHEIPGVVHIDDTARPQFVSQEECPTYYTVIETVSNRTGLPVVLNTSFNAHGKPIVNSPEQAIRALNDGLIDVLEIGQYIVKPDGVEPSIQPP